jgi:hypothetical protein
MVRDDLADVELAARVFAPHYARGMRRTVSRDVDLHRNPGSDCETLGRMSAGDIIELFDVSGGWAWIRGSFGPGYIPTDALALP